MVAENKQAHRRREKLVAYNPEAQAIRRVSAMRIRRMPQPGDIWRTTPLRDDPCRAFHTRSTLFQVRRNEAARLRLRSSTIGEEGTTVMLAKALRTFRTTWPLAALGLAVVINGVWIAALGYAIFKFF
jgi:hypothetical protein